MLLRRARATAARQRFDAADEKVLSSSAKDSAYGSRRKAYNAPAATLFLGHQSGHEADSLKGRLSLISREQAASP